MLQSVVEVKLSRHALSAVVALFHMAVEIIPDIKCKTCHLPLRRNLVKLLRSRSSASNESVISSDDDLEMHCDCHVVHKYKTRYCDITAQAIEVSRINKNMENRGDQSFLLMKAAISKIEQLCYTVLRVPTDVSKCRQQIEMVLKFLGRIVKREKPPKIQERKHALGFLAQELVKEIREVVLVRQDVLEYLIGISETAHRVCAQSHEVRSPYSLFNKVISLKRAESQRLALIGLISPMETRLKAEDAEEEDFVQDAIHALLRYEDGIIRCIDMGNEILATLAQTDRKKSSQGGPRPKPRIK